MLEGMFVRVIKANKEGSSSGGELPEEDRTQVESGSIQVSGSLNEQGWFLLALDLLHLLLWVSDSPTQAVPGTVLAAPPSRGSKKPPECCTLMKSRCSEDESWL